MELCRAVLYTDGYIAKEAFEDMETWWNGRTCEPGELKENEEVFSDDYSDGEWCAQIPSSRYKKSSSSLTSSSKEKYKYEIWSR